MLNASTNLCNLNHPPSFITEKEKKAEGIICLDFFILMSLLFQALDHFICFFPGDEVDTRWILNPEIPIATSVVPEVESSLMVEQNKSGPGNFLLF